MNHHHEPDGDARGVVDLMERSMAGVHAPVDRLGSTAIAEGRTLRRRRRAGSVVACLAAAAIVGVALPQLAGTSGRAETPIASSGPTAVDTPSPPAGAGATGWWDMPAPEMRDRLADVLPDGTRIDSAETWNNDRAPEEEASVEHGYLVATLSRDDLDGPGGLNMVFYPPDGSRQPMADSPSPDPDEPGHATATLSGEPQNADLLSCPGNLTGPHECTLVRDADGAVIAREATYESGGIAILSVDYRTADGGVVYVCVANSVDDKWGPGSDVSASEPPLTMDELRSIAEDRTWTEWAPPAE